MLTELAVLTEEAVVQIPEQFSFEEAATLPCAAEAAALQRAGAVPTRWDAFANRNPPFNFESGGGSLFFELLSALFQFFRRHVFDVGSYSPEISERVRDLARAVAVKHGLRLSDRGRAGLQSAFVGRIDVFYVNIQRIRFAGRVFGHRICQHDQGIPNLKLGMPDFSARPRHAHPFFCVENLLKKINQFLSTIDSEVGSDRVIAVREMFGCHSF
jgi:hypothetical protein